MKNVKIVNIAEIEGKPPRTAGGGGLWRRLISNEDTESGMLLGYSVIKPGEGRAWHSHPLGEDEIFFIFEGKALAEWVVDGRNCQQEIEAGTAFYTPGETEHNVTNIGEGELLAVYCIARSVPTV